MRCAAARALVVVEYGGVSNSQLFVEKGRASWLLFGGGLHRDSLAAIARRGTFSARNEPCSAATIGASTIAYTILGVSLL